MRLKVLDKINETDYRCETPSGKVCSVDLFVDGKLPNDCVIKRGMIIEIDYMYPYMYIASNPHIIEETSA